MPAWVQHRRPRAMRQELHHSKKESMKIRPRKLVLDRAAREHFGTGYLMLIHKKCIFDVFAVGSAIMGRFLGEDNV